MLEPEYGDARVFFWGPRRATPVSPLFQGLPGAQDAKPEAMVALTRAPGALPIYMDAETRKSSEELWRSVVRQCGVTELGRR